MTSSNKFLVVVDMQNDFITGSLGTKDAQAIVPAVVQKIKTCYDDGYFILVTQDTHQDATYLDSPEGRKLHTKHCIEGTCGWEICDEVKEAIKDTGYILVAKSSFYSNTLASAINQLIDPQCANPPSIEFVGLCTNICVLMNAITCKALAKDKEIDVVVHASCCAGTTPELHRSALDVMRSCQIEVPDG